MSTIEYRVRPVTRFIITRYHSSGENSPRAAGSDVYGEFDNEERAILVAQAMVEFDTQSAKFIGHTPSLPTKTKAGRKFESAQIGGERSDESQREAT